jgi:hypothetical protein
MSEPGGPLSLADSDFTLRFGESVIVEFIRGHTAADVLRELVQNEYDAGGENVLIHFGSNALTVTGTGKPIDARGWRRLSVMLGTGAVAGVPGTVEAKSNGIGSKNFGLRSLFLFGDRITIRSGGQLTVLDRHRGALSHPRPDAASAGRAGVEIQVPYRTQLADRLLPFDPDTEAKALDDIARDLPHVLVKLARAAGRPGISHVTVRSDRQNAQIAWRQSARDLPGATAVRRSVRIDTTGDMPTGVPARLDEVEFQRAVRPPADLRGTSFPGYYKRAGGWLTIGIAFRLRGSRLAREFPGRFFYPLAAPAAWTGYAFDINAPFEVNEDRSRLVPPGNSAWNAWLIDQAAQLAIARLPDLHDRYGLDAYRILTALPTAAASVDELPAALARLLSTERVWKTADTRRGRRPIFSTADTLAMGEPALIDVLETIRNPDTVLHRDLAADLDVRRAALDAGARTFGVNALVRVRSGGPNATLRTRVVAPEISLSWKDYPNSLGNLPLQSTFADALDRVRTKLTPDHRADLAAARATLTAAGTLAAPNTPLYVVPDDAADAVPGTSRLHPDLANTRVLPGLCRRFNMSAWAQDLAGRAGAGTASNAELDAFTAALRHGVKLSAPAWAAVRNAPILPSPGGGRVAAARAARRTTPGLEHLQPAVPLLTVQDELNKALAPLRVRNKLMPADLITLAELVAAGDVPPERFTAAVSRLPALLTPKTLKALADIPCLRTRSRDLIAPSHGYAPTSAVLDVLDDTVIVDAAPRVSTRLGCLTSPRVTDIRARLTHLAAQTEPPPDLAALFAALAHAAQRERFALRSLANDEILWTGTRWAAPTTCLTGSRWRTIFSATDAVPVFTGPLSEVYTRLGAHAQPAAEHWRALLESISDRYGSAKAPRSVASALAKTYALLAGPPDGLHRAAKCLLDTTGHLHSLNDVAAGRLLVNDDPALADAIREVALPIAFADQTDPRATTFWHHAGVQPLSSAARTTETRPGPSVPERIQTEPTLTRLQNPAFASAVTALAAAVLPGFRLSELSVRTRLRRIQRIEFVRSLERRYKLRVGTISVPVDVHTDSDAIQLTPVTSQHELHQAVARAITALLHPEPRSELLLADPLYFLLRCNTPEQLSRELGRRKISWSADGAFGWGDDEPDIDSTLAEQLAESLLHKGPAGRDHVPPPAPPTPPADPPPRPPLPNLSDVHPRRGGSRPPRPPGFGGGGTGGSWAPRTERQRQEDDALARHGEQVVLREERDRLARLGISPDQAVWVAQANPSADHDIRSVHEDGSPLYIEVKSTRGRDGRFSWPRAEFQLAMRQRPRYVLYRIYEADTTAPLIIGFLDPIALLQEGRLILNLEALSADIGPAD